MLVVNDVLDVYELGPGVIDFSCVVQFIRLVGFPNSKLLGFYFLAITSNCERGILRQIICKHFVKNGWKCSHLPVSERRYYYFQFLSEAEQRIRRALLSRYFAKSEPGLKLDHRGLALFYFSPFLISSTDIGKFCCAAYPSMQQTAIVQYITTFSTR